MALLEDLYWPDEVRCWPFRNRNRPNEDLYQPFLDLPALLGPGHLFWGPSSAFYGPNMTSSEPTLAQLAPKKSQKGHYRCSNEWPGPQRADFFRPFGDLLRPFGENYNNSTPPPEIIIKYNNSDFNKYRNFAIYHIENETITEFYLPNFLHLSLNRV